MPCRILASNAERASTLFVFLLVAAFSVQPALAQQAGSSALGDRGAKFATLLNGPLSPNESDSATFEAIRKDVSEVVVFFTVMNGHKYVEDLSPNEISITDDGKPPERISEFARETSLPLRLGLLVDSSPSVQSRFKFERKAAKDFLRRNLRTGIDHGFVTLFSDHPDLMQDYTDNVEQLASSISPRRAGETTAIFDAVRRGCEKLAEGEPNFAAARVLLLLSDGEDNSSRSSIEQAIQAAQHADVTIYSIGTNEGGISIEGDQVLKHLAEETGGKAFFPNNFDATKSLFAGIERDIRSRYLLAYQPKDFVADGSFRRIQIVAKRVRHRFRVHARSGYYASPSRRSNE